MYYTSHVMLALLVMYDQDSLFQHIQYKYIFRSFSQKEYTDKINTFNIADADHVPHGAVYLTLYWQHSPTR